MLQEISQALKNGWSSQCISRVIRLDRLRAKRTIFPLRLLPATDTTTKAGASICINRLLPEGSTYIIAISAVPLSLSMISVSLKSRQSERK